MARTERGFRSWMTLSIALMVIGALFVFSGVAMAEQPGDLHCPDGWLTKDESGADDNALVPAAGTVICVKAGSTQSNESELGNTGIIVADGEMTLQEYLFEAGIVDGSGEMGRDVSYWVTYPELSAEIHVWKDAPDDPDEAFDFGGGAVLKDGEMATAYIGTEYLLEGWADIEIVEMLTEEQVEAGWMLDEVVCDTELVEPIEDGVIVTVEPGDEVTCTFSNVLVTEEPTPTPTPTPTPAESTLPSEQTPTPAPTATPGEGTLPDTGMPLGGIDVTIIGTLLMTAGATLSVTGMARRRSH
jgi:hypothetical protein